MFSCCACNRKERTSTDNDEESSSEDSSSSAENSDKVIETVEEIKFTDYVIIPLKDENHVEEEEEEEEKEEEEKKEEGGDENSTGSKELSAQKNLEKIIEDVEEITVNVDVINSDDELDEKKNGENYTQEVAKTLEDSLNSEETVVDVEEVNGNGKSPQEEEQNDSGESETINFEDIQIENGKIEEIVEENSQNDVTKEIIEDSPEENGHKEEIVEEKLLENDKKEDLDELISSKNLSEPILNAEGPNIIPDDPVVPYEEENLEEEEEEYDDMMDLPSPPPEFLERNLPSPPPEFLENLVSDQKTEGLNFEEDDQEDICESKESSSSKSSVIMAVSNGDNEVNGHMTLSEMNSPELNKKNIEEKEELALNKELELMEKNGDIKLVGKNGNNDNEEMSPLSESPNSCEEALNICKIVIEKGVMAPPKSNGLFQAPGYIERTLVDGPDEDGDDSVFERSITAESSAAAATADDSRLQKPVIRWLSQEDDDSVEVSGMLEPPATPIAKDELALRRHRFFSDLLHATNSSAIHKVHFDPLGPLIHSGCDSDREDHLEELVTRLENVTKRLESVPEKFIVETQEVAIQTQTPSPKRTKKFTELSQSVDEPTTTTTTTTEVVNNGDTQFKNIDPTVIMSIANYEEIIAGPVAEFLQLSRKIGGDVSTHSDLVEKAFQIQLQFIKTAASRPAPSSQSEQVSLLGPTSNQIQAIQDFREKHRGSQFFNHLSAISESIPALGWVAVTPTPAPYVKEMNDAGQFYTNRVLKEWKEKDKNHAEWCKAWVQTLSDLQKFIRQHHTTGLVWAKTGSVPPPPPPCAMPPPPPTMPVGDIESLNINDDRSALFAQINQGEDITKSLKKVTSDMQTHKNKSLRTGPAPFKAPVVNNSGSMPGKITLPANAPIDKPPVFSRDGKKWLVEYQKGNKNLVVEDAEMNNVVYMYRCQDSTIVIKGKINSVVMDSCRKSSIVFDSLVSSIEFVNCQSVQMQVLGKVPTISIDKTDGCQMYLNSESLNVEVISSKSSEMNIMVPKGNGDYTEYPVPEQFKTTVNPKGLTTICVDSLG